MEYENSTNETHQAHKSLINDKKARELENEIKELEAEFKEISDKNVMTLTSCYTNNLRKVNPEVLANQLEILKSRSDELQKLALDYHFGCGRDYESPFYKSAVVTGNLARARLIEILEEVE